MTTMPDTWRRGDWMQLFSGTAFYPADPRTTDIDATDIAHALSLLCRYGGHVSRFYSVAEHSVLMSEWVEPLYALEALLHDATEAYVVDVPRPLKRQLPEYQRIEAAVWQCIAYAYNLPLELSAQTKEADERILLTERNALMPNTRYSWEQDGRLEPLPVAVMGWPPIEAERRFAARLAELWWTDPKG